MKATHPKEEKSLLTRSFHRFLQAVKKPPSRTTWLVLVVLVLVAVLVGSWFWFIYNGNAASSELWREYAETPRTPSDLERFGNDPTHKGSVQARYALADAAGLLMRSTEKLGDLTQADQARADVTKARDIYEGLMRDSGDVPDLMQKSLLGAAKANEVLGDLGKAKAEYQQLAKDYKDTTPGQIADARIKALDDANAKAAMDAIAAAYPPRTASK
jgi:hypothetical protein